MLPKAAKPFIFLVRSGSGARSCLTIALHAARGTTSRKCQPLLLTPLALAVSLLTGTAHAQQTFKLAYIDPLSGPFASVGELMLNHVQFGVGEVNAKGGVLKGTKLELLKVDSKLSAQESQTALQAAIDQGARVIVTGGSGSSVVAALVDAASKYNERNPDKAVIVMNHSSIDPDLTGKRCNFWHFQTEANTAMKMKALSNYIKKQADIRNVYLLNQDYAHGRQWAAYGKEMVALARELISKKAAPFEPSKFHDSYSEAMRALIVEKAKGKRIVAKPSPSEPQGKVVDLLDALRKSLKTSSSEAPKRARAPQKKAS